MGEIRLELEKALKPWQKHSPVPFFSYHLNDEDKEKLMRIMGMEEEVYDLCYNPS